MACQYRFHTNLLQLFAYPENSEQLPKNCVIFGGQNCCET